MTLNNNNHSVVRSTNHVVTTGTVLAILWFIMLISPINSFTVTTNHIHINQQSSSYLYATVGIFFGTSTGNTQDCADKIYETLLSNDIDTVEPIDIDTLDAGSLSSVFGSHTSLIVGTPTWNTNADTFRSGTGWDDLYYDKLPELSSILQNKKVAVFGLGDQISYGENYADAAGELYSVFQDLGCNMVPYAQTSQEGYDHVTSKSILPDTNLFCGLLLDQINQEDMTDTRISNWILQLKDGGFFSDTGDVSASKPIAAVTIVDDEEEEDDDDEEEEDDNAPTFTNTPKSVVNVVVQDIDVSNFTPHYNPKTGRTMWTSPDGRKSYITM